MEVRRIDPVSLDELELAFQVRAKGDEEQALFSVTLVIAPSAQEAVAVDDVHFLFVPG